MNGDSRPDRSMMAAVESLARFMAARAEGDPAGLFADTDVAIIENFAPYVFQGASAVQEWARGFAVHATGLAQLKPSLGAAQDFSVDGARAYFSLPTNWTGTSNGRHFSEDGGWAFVLMRDAGAWRVQAYGWAVTRYKLL